MRVIPVQEVKSFDDYEKLRKLRAKICWIKSKRHLYLNRSDQRLLEGMEVMGNWVIDNLF